MSAGQTATMVDAFTAEVIRNAVVAITGEMKANLMRTAYSSIIYEAEDFTGGLFDADGDTISIGLGRSQASYFCATDNAAIVVYWRPRNDAGHRSNVPPRWVGRREYYANRTAYSWHPCPRRVGDWHLWDSSLGPDDDPERPAVVAFPMGAGR
jgi:hypothetical protein